MFALENCGNNDLAINKEIEFLPLQLGLVGFLIRIFDSFIISIRLLLVVCSAANVTGAPHANECQQCASCN
jgi:hypothetical protein